MAMKLCLLMLRWCCFVCWRSISSVVGFATYAVHETFEWVTLMDGVIWFAQSIHLKAILLNKCIWLITCEWLMWDFVAINYCIRYCAPLCSGGKFHSIISTLRILILLRKLELSADWGTGPDVVLVWRFNFIFNFKLFKKEKNKHHWTDSAF